MNIFVLALASGMLSCAFAAVLAIRLKKTDPGLHAEVDGPTGFERMPFWVLHFSSPARFRSISAGLRILALASMAGLVLSVALLAVFVIRVASESGN